MKAIGIMTPWKALEFTYMPMEIFTLENGNKINIRELEKCNLLMVLFMMGNGKTIRLRERGFLKMI